MIEKKSITDDGRTYIDMDDSKLNPCLTCGACCHYFRISFYEGELLAGFPPEGLTEPLGRPYSCMKGTREGGRCVALEGTVGVDIKCTIYSERPSVCREYEVWNELGEVNPRCNKARAKHNLPELPKTKKEWILNNVYR